MFRGRTDAATFAAAAGWVNALFVGVTIAFPFLLYGLLSISGCRSTGGACGALGLVLAIWIKPMIYLAYVLSFLGLAARRLRDASLPAALAFGLFVLMLSDLQWGIVMGAPWSVGFATGYGGGLPLSLMAGLACVGALSLLPPLSSNAERDRRTLSPAAFVLLALLMLVAISSLISVFNSMFVGISPWSMFIHSRPMAPSTRLPTLPSPRRLSSLVHYAIANGWPWAGPAPARRWRRRLPYASPSSRSDPPRPSSSERGPGWRSSRVREAAGRPLPRSSIGPARPSYWHSLSCRGCCASCRRHRGQAPR